MDEVIFLGSQSEVALRFVRALGITQPVSGIHIDIPANGVTKVTIELYARKQELDQLLTELSDATDVNHFYMDMVTHSDDSMELIDP